jgi:hypothetical protein
MARTGNGMSPLKSVKEATTSLGVMTNPDFVSVAIFCVLGLLITLNVMLRLPDFAAFLTS